MRKFVLDLEANFSAIDKETGEVVASGRNLPEQIEAYKAKCKEGGRKPEIISDYAVPFNSRNSLEVIGVYTPHNNKYLQFRPAKDNLSKLREIVAESEMIIGHNVKYDVHWLKAIGIDTDHLIQDDTLVREFILRGGKDTYEVLGLDTVAPLYGGTNKVDIIKPMWKKWINNCEIDHEILDHYLYMDVWNTWKVWQGQEASPKRKIFDKILNMKRALNGAVQRMEYNGIYVDRDKALDIREKFYDMRAEAQAELLNLIEKRVAPKLLMALPEGLTPTQKKKFREQNEDEYVYDKNSNKDNMHLLYGLKFKEEGEKIPYKVGKSQRYLYKAEIEWRENYKKLRSKAKLKEYIDKCFDKIEPSFGVKPIPHKEVVKATGFSCGNKAIEALHEAGNQTKRATAILNVLTKVSAINTWISNNINPMIGNCKDESLIHASFNIAGTISGRFSSSAPNMQNLPSKKKNDGKNNVRECVKSRFGEDGCIVAIDYSQLELRFVMEYVGSAQGIKDYNDGVDMHEATARMVYDAKHGEGSFDQLDEKEYKFWRGEAKTVNFGLLYGARAVGEIQEALEKAFYDRYPEVTTWHNLVEDIILCKQYYQSPITKWAYNFKGATRDNFWSGFSKDKTKGWRNRSRNIPIQGGGNEVIQLATIEIDKELLSEGEKDILLIGQVHDELLFDCKKKKLDKCLHIGYKHMEKEIAAHYMLWFGYSLSTPFTVEAEVGEDWFNMKEVEVK